MMEIRHMTDLSIEKGIKRNEDIISHCEWMIKHHREEMSYAKKHLKDYTYEAECRAKARRKIPITRTKEGK